MNDEKLLKLLKAQPDRGIGALIEQYGGLVYSVVRARLGSSFCQADVDSCAADTFSEFYADIAKLDLNKGSIKSWLCMTARHNAVDLMRRDARRSGEVSLDREEAYSIAAPDSVENEFIKRTRINAMLDALDELEEPDRQILVRKYYLAQPSKQIANELDLSVSNVDTRTHRALKKLRGKLGGEYYEE